MICIVNEAYHYRIDSRQELFHKNIGTVGYYIMSLSNTQPKSIYAKDNYLVHAKYIFALCDLDHSILFC